MPAVRDVKTKSGTGDGTNVALNGAIVAACLFRKGGDRPLGCLDPPGYAYQLLWLAVDVEFRGNKIVPCPMITSYEIAEFGGTVDILAFRGVVER